MAGLKAAAAAPTWPTINGYLIPPAGKAGFWDNVLYDKLIIHFIHRTLAYTIGIAVFYWWWKSKSISNSSIFNKAKTLTLAVVFTQIILGILTVLSSPGTVAGKFGLFEWLAQLHQLMGMLLLLSLATVAYLTSKKMS
jgi:cytochrome c oxidase assembly protein subunit 15